MSNFTKLASILVILLVSIFGVIGYKYLHTQDHTDKLDLIPPTLTDISFSDSLIEGETQFFTLTA